MTLSYEKQSTDYLPVLRDIVGEKLTRVYDILIFLYLFTTTVVMIAGSGATGQAFEISYWWGIIFIVFALVFLFMKDINGLLAVNQYIIPLLLVGLVSFLLLFTFNQ